MLKTGLQILNVDITVLTIIWARQRPICASAHFSEHGLNGTLNWLQDYEN